LALPLFSLLLLLPMISSLDYGVAAGGKWMEVVAVVNLICVTALAYGYFLTAIAEEREADVFDLLRLTGLNSLSMILGKWGSRLVAVILLIVVQIPLLLLAVTLGGLGMEQVIGFFMGLIGWCLLVSGIGLVISTITASATSAVITGFAAVGSFSLCFTGLRSLTAVLVRREWISSEFESAFDWLAGMLSKLLPLSLESLATSPAPLLAVLKGPFPLQAGCCVVCVILSIWLLPRMAFSENRCPGPQSRGSSKGAITFRYRLQRPPTANPIGWKTFYFVCGGRRWLIARSIILTLILVTLLVFLYSFSSNLSWVRGSLSAKDFLFLGARLAFVLLTLEVLFFFSRVWSTEWKTQTLGSLLLATGAARATTRNSYLGWLRGLTPYLVFAGAIALGTLVCIFSRKGLTGWIKIGSSLDLWYFAISISIESAQLYCLAGLLTHFTLKLRSGGTIAALGIWIGSSIVTSIVTALIGSGSRGAGEEFFQVILAIIFIIPHAMVGFAMFTSARQLLETRAEEC
jgi:hypothetical protein